MVLLFQENLWLKSWLFTTLKQQDHVCWLSLFFFFWWILAFSLAWTCSTYEMHAPPIWIKTWKCELKASFCDSSESLWEFLCDLTRDLQQRSESKYLFSFLSPPHLSFFPPLSLSEKWWDWQAAVYFALLSSVRLRQLPNPLRGRSGAREGVLRGAEEGREKRVPEFVLCLLDLIRL